MLKQNWFVNMEMFDEYYETQQFYDKETKCIYVVSEDPYGNTIITEYQEGSKDYVTHYNKYLEWKSQNLSAQIFVNECERIIERLTDKEMDDLYENGTIDISMLGLATKLNWGAEPYNRILDALRLLITESEVD